MIEAVAGFRYKPGWSFGCTEVDGSSVKISVSSYVICVDKGTPMTLMSEEEFDISRWWLEDVGVAVSRLVSKVERHEMKEHLSWNGLRLDNPHPERGEEKLAFRIPIR